jgi:hypothetical protein
MAAIASIQKARRHRRECEGPAGNDGAAFIGVAARIGAHDDVECGSFVPQ